MDNEEAEKLLVGKTAQEIKENWGEPDSMLSGFYGDIYEYEGKLIFIYYDGDHKVVNVRIGDQQLQDK